MTTSMREEIKVGAMAIRFLVEGEESGGSVAVFEFDVPAGSRVAAAHSHDGYEETIYGLEGVLTWTVEGRPDRRRPRRGALHPPGRRAPVRQHPATSTPGRSRSSRPASSAPTTSARSRPILDAAAGGPPDLAAIGAVMRRHGLTLRRRAAPRITALGCHKTRGRLTAQPRERCAI